MRGPTGPLLVVFSRQSDNHCTARLHLSSAFDYVNERQFEACNRTCGLVEPRHRHTLVDQNDWQSRQIDRMRCHSSHQAALIFSTPETYAQVHSYEAA